VVSVVGSRNGYSDIVLVHIVGIKKNSFVGHANRTKKKIDRWEAGILFRFYVCYALFFGDEGNYAARLMTVANSGLPFFPKKLRVTIIDSPSEIASLPQGLLHVFWLSTIFMSVQIECNSLSFFAD
jgi:hypothetical protein